MDKFLILIVGGAAALLYANREKITDAVGLQGKRYRYYKLATGKLLRSDELPYDFVEIRTVKGIYYILPRSLYEDFKQKAAEYDRKTDTEKSQTNWLDFALKEIPGLLTKIKGVNVGASDGAAKDLTSGYNPDANTNVDDTGAIPDDAA